MVHDLGYSEASATPVKALRRQPAVRQPPAWATGHKPTKEGHSKKSLWSKWPAPVAALVHFSARTSGYRARAAAGDLAGRYRHEPAPVLADRDAFGRPGARAAAGRTGNRGAQRGGAAGAAEFHSAAHRSGAAADFLQGGRRTLSRREQGMGAILRHFARSVHRQVRLRALSPRPGTGEKHHARDQELFTNPGSQSYEAAIVAADGNVHHTIYNKATFNKVDGSVAGLIGTITDVNELKHAEAALREGEERFRDLTELSSDWYWEQDADFRFTHLSSKIREFIPDADRMVGRKRWEFPVSGVTEEQWQAHKELLAAHAPFRDFDLSAPRPRRRDPRPQHQRPADLRRGGPLQGLSRHRAGHYRGKAGGGTHPAHGPPRRPDRPAEPAAALRPHRPGDGARPARAHGSSRCCSSTSTASRTSTTRSATRSATGCCSRSPSG